MSVVTRRRAGGATSAGRVQSVAARLVVERERARMAFRSASYWDLEGTFNAHDTEFPATLVVLDGKRLATGRDFEPTTGQLAPSARRRPPRRDGVPRRSTERLRDAPFRVASVESKSTTERPRPPFTTSTLQQEAGRKLGFSAARAMSVAQTLYENGYITYMRTDSTNLSDQALNAARDQILKLYGKEYLPEAPRTYRGKVKNAQEAHEAIRPAGEVIRMPDDVAGELHSIGRAAPLRAHLDADDRVPDGRRAHPARHGAPRGDVDVGRARHLPGHRPDDRVPGLPARVRRRRRRSRTPSSRTARRSCPPLAEADPVACRELHASGHTTQPPARYTEASLVKELEERGIGRPSTYAVVLDTLLRRDYVWKKGNALVPTWTAFAKMQLLERYFAHLIDYEFTATMEEALDVIARGEGEAEKWLHSFYFGNGVAGLRDLCTEDHLATIDVAEVNAVPIGHDAEGREIIVRVWSNGASVVRGDEKAPVPVDLAPDELTIEKAEELIAKGAGGPRDARRRPRHRTARARADRPVRPVRAARRDGRRAEGEAQARVAVRRPWTRRRSRSKRRWRCWRCRASSARATAR